MGIADFSTEELQKEIFQKKMNTKVYGQHLILDCYNCDSNRLSNVNIIYDFLDQFPAKIGMQKIGPPQIVKFTDESLAGITGIIMIVTSHISIHTYNLKCCCFLDIFSCNEFDVDAAEKHVKECFFVGKIEKTLIQRGLH